MSLLAGVVVLVRVGAAFATAAATVPLIVSEEASPERHVRKIICIWPLEMQTRRSIGCYRKSVIVCAYCYGRRHSRRGFFRQMVGRQDRPKET